MPLDDDVREKQPIGFITLFSVPENYIANKKRILDDIIKPAIAELSDIMQITVTVNYDAKKRGKPVSGYRFDFTTIDRNKKKEVKEEPTQMSIDEYLEDTLMDVLEKSGLEIGFRSANTIMKSCIKHKRDSKYLQEAIELVKKQGAEDVGAKLNSFIVRGFDKPQKAYKKGSFHNFPQQDYDFEALERLVRNQTIEDLTPMTEEQKESYDKLTEGAEQLSFDDIPPHKTN